MAKNLFSIPIFFIVFRETLEAAIIVSVLLGLAEQIVSRDPNFTPETSGEEDAANNSEPVVDDVVQRRRLLRKMRIQVNQKKKKFLFFWSICVINALFCPDFFGSWSRIFHRSCCWCCVRITAFSICEL